jgi:succinoglycan biosynthesis protein ExoA
MVSVSVIVPCYNEKKRIGSLLDAIYAQTFPHTEMEVVITDDNSTDGTREVIFAWREQHRDLSLRVVEKPDGQKRGIPSALNRAIDAAVGEIIVRLDGHAAPYHDYIEKAVLALRSDLGENVGGVWDIRPGANGWVARSIALAAAHPLGVGDALYRHARQAAYVDTVPFGVFKRETWLKAGKFDETLLTNEDYEFNVRVRQNGGRVWLDPQIRSVYYARSSHSQLAKQYWRYGFWKLKMLRRYPGTLRWRQGLPPLFVASVLIGFLLSWVVFFRWLLIFEITMYFFVLAMAGLHKAYRVKSIPVIIGLPLAIATMHLSWGSAFLWSMIPVGRSP